MQTTVELIRRHSSPDWQTCQLFFRTKDRVDFVEGQFVMLEPHTISSHPHKPPKRAYSIGSAMQLMRDEQTLSTIVKYTWPGGMSDYLVNHLHEGDNMILSGPYGHMVDTSISKNYLLISVGSGITPVYSIYQKLIQTHDYDRIAWIYGERYTKNLLPNLTHERAFNESPHCRHRCYLSRETNHTPPGWNIWRVGESLDAALEYLGGNDVSIFLCGHPDMVDEMKNILINDKGFDKGQVKFEKY